MVQLSKQQAQVLFYLSARPAESIAEICRMEHQGHGHRASYDRVHRLARRGLVSLRGKGSKIEVSITERGRAVIRDH